MLATVFIFFAACSFTVLISLIPFSQLLYHWKKLVSTFCFLVKISMMQCNFNSIAECCEADHSLE